MKRLLALVTVAILSASAWAGSSDEFNFRFSPLGLLVGGTTLTFDIKVAPDWTVGPELFYRHFKLSATDDFSTASWDETAWGAGVRATWFHNGAFTDGFYVGPKLSYAAVKITDTDSFGNTRTGSASAVLAGCLVGYGWYWDSFNIMLGIGADVSLGGTNISVQSTNGNSTSINATLAGLDGEFSLGFTF